MPCPYIMILCNFFELVLRGSAYRTAPVFRELFKGYAWFNTVVRVPFFRIIKIAANSTFPLFHLSLLCCCLVSLAGAFPVKHYLNGLQQNDNVQP